MTANRRTYAPNHAQLMNRRADVGGWTYRIVDTTVDSTGRVCVALVGLAIAAPDLPTWYNLDKLNIIPLLAQPAPDTNTEAAQLDADLAEQPAERTQYIFSSPHLTASTWNDPHTPNCLCLECFEARASAITAIVEANPAYRAACAALDLAYNRYQMGLTNYNRAELAAASAAYDAAMETITAEAEAICDDPPVLPKATHQPIIDDLIDAIKNPAAAWVTPETVPQLRARLIEALEQLKRQRDEADAECKRLRQEANHYHQRAIDLRESAR